MDQQTKFGIGAAAAIALMSLLEPHLYEAHPLLTVSIYVVLVGALVWGFFPFLASCARWLGARAKVMWPQYLMFVCGLGFFVGLVAFLQMNVEKPRAADKEVTPPTKPENEFKLSDRPSLISMFVRDLNPPVGFQIAGCSVYNNPEWGTIYYKIIGDVPANSKFLSFYIPSSPHFLAIVNSIAAEYSDWIVRVENTIHVHNNVQGDTTPVHSRNMVFSNVIYVYHEDLLDAVEVGQLTKTFQDKGLTLQLRGTSYLLGAWDAIKAGRIPKVPEYRPDGCNVVPVKG